MSDPLDVVGTGSMVADRIFFPARIAGPEEKALLAPAQGAWVQERVGGVTLNHLGWARILGLRTGVFGKQADDAAGRFLRAGMRRLGIETSIDLGGSASAFAQIFVDPRGERVIYMARGATAELTPDEVDSVHRGFIERARIVTSEVSQAPLGVVRRTLEIARDAGALRVLDVDVPLADAVPALGSEEELQAVLGLADVLKPSLAALDGLVGGGSPAQRAEELGRKHGARAVALTCGAEGSVIWADGAVVRAPAARVEVRDTTGAGDAFLGGLLAALHRGLDWEAASLLGNACGGACCEQVGAFPDPPARARERVLELLAQLGGPALDWPELPGAGGEDALSRFLERAPDELARAAAGMDRAALEAAATLVLEAEAAGGRVHVTGIGKPEHVAHYAASLLSSTGTPASFLHGTEVTHGSVGQMRPGDVVIAISNSGTTRELIDAVEAVRGFGARVIAVTRDPASPLGARADRVLAVAVDHEGGPLGLAPRASILAQTLALQALSVVLQERRGFSAADYAARHPAGALGARSRSES